MSVAVINPLPPTNPKLIISQNNHLKKTSNLFIFINIVVQQNLNLLQPPYDGPYRVLDRSDRWTSTVAQTLCLWTDWSQHIETFHCPWNTHAIIFCTSHYHPILPTWYCPGVACYSDNTFGPVRPLASPSQGFHSLVAHWRGSDVVSGLWTLIITFCVTWLLRDCQPFTNIYIVIVACTCSFCALVKKTVFLNLVLDSSDKYVIPSPHGR